MRVVPTRRARWLAIGAVATALGGVAIVRPYFQGLSFVIRAADIHGLVRRAAAIGTHGETERLIDIPTKRGTLRGRWYEPDSGPRRTALLVSGVHPAGIDEPRLVALARELAASGVGIVTPDIPELSKFSITPVITDAIEDIARWLSTTPTGPHISQDGRVGLMGISFSGGLSVVAAGREALRDHVAYVLSFGGHDDLPRVLHYLCTGIEPPRPREFRLEGDRSAAVVRPPHDYGLAVLLLGVADRVVPPAQVDALRAGVERFLWASHLDRVDKGKAEQEFAALRDVARQLPKPSATLLDYVNNRDVVHLGVRLLPYIGAYGASPALSPSKSPKPSAPIFILHGADDNVIPAVESEYLADDLRGHAPVRLLLSALISHAEADRDAHVSDVMNLAEFWGDLLKR